MPATVVSFTPKSVYDYVGKNMAPSAPLEALATRKIDREPNKLADALLKKYNQYKERDYQTYTENCDVGRMISNLRTGKLLLMRSVRDGRYLFVKREGKFSDNKTVGGKFQFYSTKLTAEWLSSRPERDPVIPSDDDQIEEFMAGVKIVQDYYDKRFFDTNYETAECHSAQDFGTWITRFRYDPHRDDIICELLDFPACRWDVRFTAEESSYFIYESKCSTAVLENLLDAEIDGDGAWHEQYGLQVIEQLARTGGNVEGEGKERPYGTYDNGAKENVVSEMWLQPEAYCDIELDQSEATVAGINIPKGRTSLLDVFPTGMCVVGINGMKTIIGLYAENHKDHIVSGRYHVQSFSGVGKGISDAVDVMKELNDLHSQLLAHVKSHAMPGFGYNSAVVTEEMARNIGKPRRNIPIDFTNAPDGARSINDVVQAIMPGNPGNAAFAYKESLEGDLQMAMQVTQFSENPVLGVQSNTATGDKIRDANAATILVPQHLNKADHRKRADKVIYNLFKRFCNKPKFFATRDKNGITKGRYLEGSQFSDVDIEFEIVSNSEIPVRPYAQREALAQILQFSGGMEGLLMAAQQNPEMTGEIVQAFGAKLSIPTPKDIARVCRKRIEQAKQLLKVELTNQQLLASIGAPPVDNTNLAAAVVSRLTPPISPKEPFANQKCQWYAELLDSDELQYSPPELRYVIEELIDRQLQESALGQAQVQNDQSMATIMGNLPMLVGEQALNQQNQQLEAQAQQAQQQAQLQQQQQTAMIQSQTQLAQQKQQAEIDQTTSEAQHSQALALNAQEHAQGLQQMNVEHAQNLQLEDMKQKAAIQVAKARPKPVASKK